MPAKADQNRAIRGDSAIVLIHRRSPGPRFRLRATISAYERAALRSAKNNLTTLNNVLPARPRFHQTHRPRGRAARRRRYTALAPGNLEAAGAPIRNQPIPATTSIAPSVVPSISLNREQLLGGCDAKRVRDPVTNQCRGPGDLRREQQRH